MVIKDVSMCAFVSMRKTMESLSYSICPGSVFQDSTDHLLVQYNKRGGAVLSDLFNSSAVTERVASCTRDDDY